MSERSAFPIVIVTGRSPSAREMVGIYVKAFGRANLRIVEERPPGFSKLFRFLRARIRNRGVLSALDAMALRAVMGFFPAPRIEEVVPDLVVAHANDPGIAALVKREGVGLVVLSICSLLNADQIARIGVPIINVHNGITPRYRGAGNLWALAEGRLDCIGATLHRVDAGVDTGARIAIARVDPIRESIPFVEIDAEAFRRGARLAVAFVEGQGGDGLVDYAVLPDRYYPFPGLFDWLRARENFRRGLRASIRVEETWQDSFQRRAVDDSLSITERLHWSDTASIAWRDGAALALLRRHFGAARVVLDVGCGDARLAPALGAGYVGCDFSEETLRLAPPGNRLCAAAAGALPFRGAVFDATLAVGLLQHLDDVQSAADELLRVTRAGGGIVLNTLRQFSRLELMVIALASVFSPSRLALVAAIWRRQHGVVRGGGLVARRYRLSELRRLFPRKARILEVRYHGGLLGPLFAREITLVAKTPDGMS
jgi:SAM-dependent methyltransferase